MLNIKKYILKKWFLILSIHFSLTQPVWGAPIVEKISEAPLPISKAAFKSKYYDTLSPIIFRKAAKTWEAAKWDFDFFADQYGDTAVSVQLNETLTGEADGPVKTTYTDTTLRRYIQHVKEHGIKAGYLNQWNILSIHPELHTFLQIPAFYASKMLTITNLWLGPKGTKSKLHYDSDHNLFTQIYGRKLVTLISPGQSGKCYPTNRTWYDGYSPIDTLNPDLAKYPLFADVVMFQAILEPGDMLYIPQGWWHDVRSLDPSISVSFWWIDWKDFIREVAAEVKFSWLKKSKLDNRNSYLKALKEHLFN